MNDITHIFFDLDHTIWDFETNSREALDEIYQLFGLKGRRIRSALDFIHVYEKINHRMWDDYRHGRINKKKLRSDRFPQALALFDIYDQQLAEEINEYYMKHSPLKTNLFDHAHSTLDYLKEKYKLYIITNGFEEVQQVKLNRSGLKHYFDKVITSEMVGVRKPDPKIFNYALEQAKVGSVNSVMIGDDLTSDVLGARACGMHGIFFNPKEEVVAQGDYKEIKCLSELKELL